MKKDKIDTPSYYAIIPAEVRYHKKLTPNAKLLYSEITCLTNKKKYCWATNTYFANLYNVNKKTISKWINSLVETGFIELKIINNNYRKIYLRGVLEKSNRDTRNHVGGVQNHVGGYTKSRRGGTQNHVPLYNSTRRIKKENKQSKLCFDGDNTLFSSNKKTEKQPSQKQAVYLYNHLKLKRKVMRSPNMNKWTDAFYNLKVKDEVPSKTINKVLKWYCKYIGEKFIPQAYSAISFRDKFDNIRECMIKSKPAMTKKLKISKDAKRFCRTFSYSVPFEEKEFEQIVQASFTRLKKWYSQCLNYFNTSKDPLFVLDCPPAPHLFADMWFKKMIYLHNKYGENFIQNNDGWEFFPQHRLHYEMFLDFYNLTKRELSNTRWEKIVKEITGEIG